MSQQSVKVNMGKATNVKKAKGKTAKSEEKAEKKSGSRRRWTENENQKLLQYLQNTIRSGKIIEKPNATVYYQNANKSLKFEDCSFSQLRNQMRNLRKKYTAAIEWRGKTGQGVLLDEGEESLQRALLKICPHFDDLDEIFGTKTSISPPFLHDSLLDDLHMCNDSQKSQHSEISLDEEEDKNKKSTLVNYGTIQPKKRKSTEQSGLEILANTAELRFQVQKGELELSKEKLEFEKRQKTESHDLDLRRFLHEQQMDEQKLDLEKKKIGNDLELAKFKVEQEFKHKLELAKLGL